MTYAAGAWARDLQEPSRMPTAFLPRRVYLSCVGAAAVLACAPVTEDGQLGVSREALRDESVDVVAWGRDDRPTFLRGTLGSTRVYASYDSESALFQGALGEVAAHFGATTSTLRLRRMWRDALGQTMPLHSTHRRDGSWWAGSCGGTPTTGETSLRPAAPCASRPTSGLPPTLLKRPRRGFDKGATSLAAHFPRRNWSTLPPLARLEFASGVGGRSAWARWGPSH